MRTPARAPSFYIEKTEEIVLINPNGVMEFWKNNRMVNSIPHASETAAINYAKERGWKDTLEAIRFFCSPPAGQTPPK